MPNRLAAESSLYLRQHADNPVDWFPWGEEAFRLAGDTGRPVLLSIGYSSCHWCHVMAHESFEDPATAAVMNELFVCVKVDREERPDVDALYMQATLALNGHGGWPMTVWLTPDQRPFYAGTYFPPQARGGLPGFADLCREIARAYDERSDEVLAQAGHLTERIARTSVRRTAPGEITPDTVDDAIVGLARMFDPVNGGFGGAPKFPPSVACEFLLRHAERHPERVHARQMLEITLLRMADGGIHDQVGGGFHRYAVDGVWLVPHFEKMLYDNALLARAYTHAHRLTGEVRWRGVAESTIDYLLREMRVGDAFAAAQDADSPGGEGAFFVWTPAQLAEVLPRDQLEAVVRYLGVTQEGNFEGATILHVAEPPDAEAADLLEAARRTLLGVRAQRPAPARDDKVVTAWNGLTVAALADAGALWDRADLLEAAARTAGFLLDHAVVDGRLQRTVYADGATNPGCLDDHADLAHGLLRLYDATFDPRWLVAARDLAARIVELFQDPEEGGFFTAGSDTPALVARTRDLEDHPSPSGNSQAAWVLARLGDLTGDPELHAAAQRAVALVRTDMLRFPHAYAQALVVADHLAHPGVQVAVVGDPSAQDTAALLAVARAAGPGVTVACGHPDDAAAVAAAPLLAERPMVDGRATAYVCRGSTCDAPVTDPDALRVLLT